MTPICPHTLSNRSLIYDYGAQIKIECVSGESALIADGKKSGDPHAGLVGGNQHAVEHDTLRAPRGHSLSRF